MEETLVPCLNCKKQFKSKSIVRHVKQSSCQSGYSTLQLEELLKFCNNISKKNKQSKRLLTKHEERIKDSLRYNKMKRRERYIRNKQAVALKYQENKIALAAKYQKNKQKIKEKYSQNSTNIRKKYNKKKRHEKWLKERDKAAQRYLKNRVEILQKREDSNKIKQSRQGQYFSKIVKKHFGEVYHQLYIDHFEYAKTNKKKNTRFYDYICEKIMNDVFNSNDWIRAVETITQEGMSDSRLEMEIENAMDQQFNKLMNIACIDLARHEASNEFSLYEAAMYEENFMKKGWDLLKNSNLLKNCINRAFNSSLYDEFCQLYEQAYDEAMDKVMASDLLWQEFPNMELHEKKLDTKFHLYLDEKFEKSWEKSTTYNDLTTLISVELEIDMSRKLDIHKRMIANNDISSGDELTKHALISIKTVQRIKSQHRGCSKEDRALFETYINGIEEINKQNIQNTKKSWKQVKKIKQGMFAFTNISRCAISFFNISLHKLMEQN